MDTLGQTPQAPPTARDVGLRICVLTHVIAVSHIAAGEQESHARLPRGEIAQAAREGTHRMMDSFWEPVLLEGLDQHFTPKERVFLTTPILDLPMKTLINGSWHSEALQMLLWSVSKVSKLTPIWEDYGEQEVRSIPRSEFVKWSEQCQLRNRPEIEDQREAAELWLWRCRTRQLKTEGASQRPDIDQIIASAAATAHEQGWAGPPVSGDFNVDGIAFSQLPDDRWQSLQSISLERLRALNWLCGMAPGNQWDLTSLDT